MASKQHVCFTYQSIVWVYELLFCLRLVFGFDTFVQRSSGKTLVLVCPQDGANVKGTPGTLYSVGPSTCRGKLAFQRQAFVDIYRERRTKMQHVTLSTLILPVVLQNFISLSPTMTLVNKPPGRFARKTQHSSLTFLLVNVNKVLFNSRGEVWKS